MGWLLGPGPVRRSLPYLKSGSLILREKVNILEIHYNMYWDKQVTPNIGSAVNEKNIQKHRKHFIPWVEAHTGLREFYFWEVPRLQYQNPSIQIIRFLESDPLPYIRAWLGDGRDILFDCYLKDRKSITDQLVKTLGDRRYDAEGVRKLENSTHLNPATWGINRPRACPCDVPGQVPCPGLVDLPMRMRGKFRTHLVEKLEEWENDPSLPYPTEAEILKEKYAFPVPIEQFHNGRVEGLEKAFMRKPDQTTRPFKQPWVIAKEHSSDRFDKASDARIARKHPAPKAFKKHTR